MFKHLKLRNKLLLSFFLVASISTVTTTLFSISYFTVQIERVAIANMRKNIEVAGLIYEYAESGARDQAISLGRDGTLRTLLGLSGLESRVTDYLRQKLDERDGHQIIAVNAERLVVAAVASPAYGLSPPLARKFDNPILEQAMTQRQAMVATEAVSLGQGSQLAMTAAVPIFKRGKENDSGALIGAVLTRLLIRGDNFPIQRMHQLLGTSATVFLDNKVVAHAPAKTPPPRAAATFLAPLLLGDQKQLEQKELSRAGQFAVYRPITGINGEIIAALAVSEPSAPYVNALLQGALTLVGLMLLCILGAFLLGYWLARSILVPIEQLLHGVKRVTSGELGYEISMDLKDELGVLARSFNGMAKQLQGLFNTLEQRVENATRKLQNTLAHLSAIIDNMADGLLVTDEEGKIVRFNPSLTHMLGHPGDLLGKDAAPVLGDNFARLVTASRQDTTQPHSSELPLDDDRVGQAVATSILQKDSLREDTTYRGTHCLGTVILIRDITREKEIDNMLKNTVDTLTKVGTALSAETNLDKLLELFIVEACRVANADGGTLYTLKEDQLHYEVMINHSMNIFLGGTYSARIELPPLPLDESKVSAHAAIHKQIIHAEDVYHNQEFDFTATKQYDAATGYHTRSMLVIPMQDRSNQVVGVLQLINPINPRSMQPARFEPNQVEIIHSLASQSAVALENVRNHEKIERKNKAFVRFVPTEFLRHLGKTEAEDIVLGDACQETMAVLFCDIRRFTSISESMTPEQNFLFLNEYLDGIGPSIVGNGGFIDKYIGDAIMALFPGTNVNMAEDSVRAAIGMQRRLSQYNQHCRAKLCLEPVEIGVGLHCGPLTLGTIGFEGRMETTVIGDTVNLASRMEGLTKQYGIRVGITEAIFQALPDPDQLQIREADVVQVKGKETPTTIYEVFDADPAPMRDWKQAHLTTFHQGIAAYRAADWAEALRLFESIPAPPEPDRIREIYLQRCRELLRAPPNIAEWNYVNRLSSK